MQRLPAKNPPCCRQNLTLNLDLRDAIFTPNTIAPDRSLIPTIAATLTPMLTYLAPQMFFDGFCALAAAMLFGKVVPQTVYEAHSHDGGLTCLGPECFLYSHLIQIASNILAIVLILMVVKRTFGLYQESKH